MTKQTYNNIWDALESDKVVAANLKMRAELMIKITEKIREKGYSQSKAASVLGVSQPRISNLVNGRISLFSIDELVNMLSALDVDVELKTRSKAVRAA